MTITRRRFREALLIGAAILGGAAIPTLANAVTAGHGPPTLSGVAPPGAERGPEALQNAPSQPMDRGVGERILLVIGGVYATEAEASRAAAEMSFGDAQGYYVVPVAQFEGLREQLSEPGDWVAATGFRTQRGVDEFLEVASAAGVPAFATERVKNLGPRYFGLGQEARPDGTGPQVGAIPGLTT